MRTTHVEDTANATAHLDRMSPSQLMLVYCLPVLSGSKKHAVQSARERTGTSGLIIAKLAKLGIEDAADIYMRKGVFDVLEGGWRRLRRMTCMPRAIRLCIWKG